MPHPGWLPGRDRDPRARDGPLPTPRPQGTRRPAAAAPRNSSVSLPDCSPRRTSRHASWPGCGWLRAVSWHPAEWLPTPRDSKTTRDPVPPRHRRDATSRETRWHSPPRPSLQMTIHCHQCPASRPGTENRRGKSTGPTRVVPVSVTVTCGSVCPTSVTRAAFVVSSCGAPERTSATGPPLAAGGRAYRV